MSVQAITSASTRCVRFILVSCLVVASSTAMVGCTCSSFFFADIANDCNILKGNPALPPTAITPSVAAVSLFAEDSAEVDLALETTFDTGDWTLGIDRSSLPNGVRARLSSSAIRAQAPVTLTIEATLSAVPTGARAPDSVVVIASSAATQRRIAVALTIRTPFTLDAVPNVTLASRDSTEVIVTFDRAADFGRTVFLSADIHPELVVSFTPNSVTLQSARMRLRHIGQTVPRTTTVRIVATRGFYSDTADVTVTITPPPQDFSIAPSVSSVTTTPGNTVVVDVRVTRVLASIGDVNLDLQGAPAGVTASFAPDPAPDSLATLRLGVAPTATPGTYPLVLRGTANGIVRTAALSLTLASAGFSLAVFPTRVALNPGGGPVRVAVAILRTTATGTVALSMTGLPSGVTASFASASTPGNATELTLVAAAGAPAVFTTAQVQGVIGSETQTVPLAIEVNASGSFAISASPANTTAISFGFGQTSILVTRDAGFTAPVALAPSGSWPKGFTASFQPATVTGTSSQLSFDVAGFVLPGPYTLQVEGTSGTLRRSATIAVTVSQYRPESGFVMSVETPMTTIVGGDSIEAALVVSRANGFTAPISVSVTGAPNGVTVTIVPATISGSSALVRIRAASTAVPGTYTLSFAGTGGGTGASSEMQLVVSGAAPPRSRAP